MMGGDVTVASEAGKGSVFTVRLPVGPDMHCRVVGIGNGPIGQPAHSIRGVISGAPF
jgi:chemotaxis protein histidine kinase CheA